MQFSERRSDYFGSVADVGEMCNGATMLTFGIGQYRGGGQFCSGFFHGPSMNEARIMSFTGTPMQEIKSNPGPQSPMHRRSRSSIMTTKSNPGPRIPKEAGDMLIHNSRPDSILPNDDGNPFTEADIHVQRAAVCCLASYCELEQARQLFQQQFRSLNFKRVYVSPLVVPDGTEGRNRQSMLVAVAATSDELSVYVAFKGNNNLAELFSNVCQPSEIRPFQDSTSQLGSYHANFCRRLKQLVPRIDGLLEFCEGLLLSSIGNDKISTCSTGGAQGEFPNVRRRLFFCGHSLGGAISHLANLYTLSMFHATTDPLDRKEQRAGPVSITFGAPVVTDRRAARSIDKYLAHGQFLSFIHAKDPVPFILVGVPTSHLAQERFQELALKHATALKVAGSILTDKKLLKFPNGSHKQESGSISRETNQSSNQGKKETVSRSQPLNKFKKTLSGKNKRRESSKSDQSPAENKTITVSSRSDQSLDKSKKTTLLHKSADQIVGKQVSGQGAQYLDKEKNAVSGGWVEFSEGNEKAGNAGKGKFTASTRKPLKSSDKMNESSSALDGKSLQHMHPPDHEFPESIQERQKSSPKKKASGGLGPFAKAFKKAFRKAMKATVERAMDGNINNQLLKLESDIKWTRRELALDAFFEFAPFGIQNGISFDKKAKHHVIHKIQPDEYYESSRYFSLAKHHLKHHKIGSYVYSLVGHGFADSTISNQQNKAMVTEGPSPSVHKAEMILIRGETLGSLKGARITARGSYLSLALDHECQVSTFSDKWRLVAAEPTRITFEFETLREADCENIQDQAELIELAKVGHGESATSVSVRTIFSGNSAEFVPVLSRDFAADSTVIDGLKHCVGKVLVLLETDGYAAKKGEAATKILHYLWRAAVYSGVKESYDLLIQRVSSTVHEKKRKVDEGFIAPIRHALCYKPITLVFEQKGAEKIERAAQVARHHLFKFFTSDEGNKEELTNPFVESLSLKTTKLKKNSAGQLMIELDSYDKILSCLHALELSHKHPGTYGEAIRESPALIKAYEKDLFQWMKDLPKEDRRNRFMENCWSHCLSGTSCDSLLFRLELIYALISAFEVAKEQKLLALIGPENAGKSTLANVLGCKSNESTGYMLHTADMKSYRLAPDLLAVDFPGIDASAARRPLSHVWETFAKLPDRCIVVTAFTGDVTQGSQVLPQLAAQKLCPDVMLVVNRVDGILKGLAGAKIWKEFSTETMKRLHKKFMQVNEKGGVNLEEVIFCCLEEEDVLYENEVSQLKARGVIFPKQVKERILDWVRRPRITPVTAMDGLPPPIPPITSSRVEQQLAGQGTTGERDSASSVRDDTMKLRVTADATTSRVTPTEAYSRDDKQMGKNVSVKEHATTISSTGSDVDMKATPLNQTTVPADDSTVQSSIQKPAIASESEESGQSSQHHDVRTEPQETTNGITKSATDSACSTHLESSRDTTLLPSKCAEEQIAKKCSIPIALECSLAAEDEKAVKSVVTGTPVPEHEKAVKSVVTETPVPEHEKAVKSVVTGTPVPSDDRMDHSMDDALLSLKAKNTHSTDQTAPTTSGSVSTVTVERDTTRQADEDTRPGLTTKEVNISLLSKGSKELICMKLLHCEKRTDMFTKINNLISDKDSGEHVPEKKSFTIQEMIDIFVTNALEKNKLIITGDIRWFEKEIELENDNLCILTV
ncbi:hypothetical protein R1flu_005102 [Riccia fluitans]|uniref:Uncharacterized protein n=1 Tax=Riccia fluitans TaxID=41844 RepID=A0ABD1YST2_9MARC